MGSGDETKRNSALHPPPPPPPPPTIPLAKNTLSILMIFILLLYLLHTLTIYIIGSLPLPSYFPQTLPPFSNPPLTSPSLSTVVHSSAASQTDTQTLKYHGSSRGHQLQGLMDQYIPLPWLQGPTGASTPAWPPMQLEELQQQPH